MAESCLPHPLVLLPQALAVHEANPTFPQGPLYFTGALESDPRDPVTGVQFYPEKRASVRQEEALGQGQIQAQHGTQLQVFLRSGSAPAS